MGSRHNYLSVDIRQTSFACIRRKKVGDGNKVEKLHRNSIQDDRHNIATGKTLDFFIVLKKYFREVRAKRGSISSLDNEEARSETTVDSLVEIRACCKELLN